MSRVIKFRAFDKNNFMGTNEPTMLYIDSLPDDVIALFDKDGGVYFLGEGMDDDIIGMQPVEIKTSPLMQFTGLHDKSGKEIYEGDVVSAKVNEITKENIYNDPCFKEGKSKYITGNKVKRVWTVEYVSFMTREGFMCYGKDRRFRLPLTRSAITNNDLYVIGNTHENPELLEA